MYGCPHCGKLKFVPFRCHSRFCPTCGNKYSMERTTSMSFKLVNVQHRHCVFTIDENLRDFFLKTVLCSTASFTLLPVSSLVCSSK
ncbi:MAG: transposase zinc-binding domain-containing protein [Ruminococcus sp.]